MPTNFTKLHSLLLSHEFMNKESTFVPLTIAHTPGLSPTQPSTHFVQKNQGTFHNGRGRRFRKRGCGCYNERSNNNAYTFTWGSWTFMDNKTR
ncbi:unnamed protein product, partial [Dovyalis caffra]